MPPNVAVLDQTAIVEQILNVVGRDILYPGQKKWRYLLRKKGIDVRKLQLCSRIKIEDDEIVVTQYFVDRSLDNA